MSEQKSAYALINVYPRGESKETGHDLYGVFWSQEDAFKCAQDRDSQNETYHSGFHLLIGAPDDICRVMDYLFEKCFDDGFLNDPDRIHYCEERADNGGWLRSFWLVLEYAPPHA